MGKKLVTIIALAVSTAAFAAKTLAPADGATVPLLCEGQKRFLDLPREERMRVMEDKGERKALKKLGHRPLAVKLEWEAKGKARVKVAPAATPPPAMRSAKRACRSTSDRGCNETFMLR